MTRTTGAGAELAARELQRAVLADWLDSLAEFKVRCVLVLGPDPFAANDARQVVAIHPDEYLVQAAALARSSSFGSSWRASQSPLVAWQNLGAEEEWTAAWLDRGVHALVRVDMPMPFRHGFECFMLAGRTLSGRNEAAAMAWSAMSVWPVIKEEVIGARFDISKREREVLVALAEGLTAREAAVVLGCTERTVTFHITNVALKLRAPNRAAAIQRACSLGLV